MKSKTHAVSPPASQGSKLLLNMHEAATLAGVSLHTWLRMTKAGEAPAGVKLRDCRRWSRAELEQWIASGCRPMEASHGGR